MYTVRSIHAVNRSSRNRLRPACGPRRGDRRGFSLLMVMLAVSLCLTLTYGFLRSQATVRRIDENSGRRDQALAAARAGMAIALREMNSADWGGVSAEVSRIVESDATGTASFHASWHRVVPNDPNSASAPASGLDVVVRSVGTWQAADDPNERLERTIEAVARMQPRLPGRDLGPADAAYASDLQANPSQYDSMQNYALVSTESSNSLSLEPGDRIDGNVWLRERLAAYQEPAWGSTVRNQFLSDVGTKYVQTATTRVFKHPHPLAGRVDFYMPPDSSTVGDLNRIKALYATTSQALNLPMIAWSDWSTYRIYEKGFTYSAVSLPSTLQSVTLRPTADNPLGIFYHVGTLRIENDVVVQGTLVVTDEVEIAGRRVHLTAFNWRGDAGKPLVDDRALWQRLPAIVTRSVEIERESASVIEGAVIAADRLRGAGGTLEYVAANNVDIVGTAMASPLRQPFSSVKLQGNPTLTSIDGTGRYAVWLATTDGNSGQWYRIVGVDASGKTLTVQGDVEKINPVASRIRPLRQRYADIRGPLTGKEHDVDHQPTWLLTELLWGTLHTTWSTTNSLLALLGLPRPLFIDFLADTGNLLSLGAPLTSTGMVLEPTFHLTHHGEKSYRWEPPLFRPYDAAGDDADHEGYRWSVTEWREVP